MNPIDRQVAIDAALTFLDEYCSAAFDEDMQKMLCERLDALPSAQPEIVLCRDCIHNPKETWFECPMAHLSEKQKPDTAWCWKGQRRAE